VALTRLLSASLSMLPARGRRLPPVVPIRGMLAPTRAGGQGVPPYAVRRALAARVDPCSSDVVVVV